MGLLVKQGKHQIELKYSTPHLKQGMIVSAFGFGVLLVTDYVRKRRQKNKQIAC